MIKEFLIYTCLFIGLFGLTFYLINLILNREKKREKITNLPKVSIVIPAFNEEKTVYSTIETAYNLNYPKDKLEIIVVDDGSKDKTYENAIKFKSKIVKVYRKENGGKGTALNYGIKKSRGEIIVTMDADSMADKEALIRMIEHFDDKEVMCVAPTIIAYKPKNIFERIQQIEYVIGVFLRKSFASLNAIHITPGAFSVYRKKFFDKYGLFDEHNITEDMEMALRIQANNYKIAYCPSAVIETKVPKTFIALLKQRRRWYTGLIRNLWNYRRLFSLKYGYLGMVVLPMAMTGIFFSIVLTIYLLIDTLIRIKKELILLKSVGFSFSGWFDFDKFALERFAFNFFSKPYAVFFILFIFILIGYLLFAKYETKKKMSTIGSFPFFLLFFSILFAFWWVVSISYILLRRKVSWR